ncbi:MAG: HAMP domain-containing sensor histidine kinase [Syntrophotaleaceae bacterium]
MIGSPYHEWLPAIRRGADDALRQVVLLGVPVRLADYRFVSWNGVWTADVVAEPLVADDGAIGAQVKIGPLRPCRKLKSGSEGQGWNDMGKVAALLSHGVRNPLNAIKGAVSYLQGRYADEVELQEFAGIMVEEISRLEQFISGFLSTSSCGSRPELVQVAPLLKKVTTYTFLQAQAAGVSIVLRCDDVLPVCIDAYQFEQAVLNLLNNALEVLEEGGRIVLSSTMTQRAGLPMVVVEVADNGPGMDLARVEALHDSSSEPEPGKDRGFGLFITREVVASYGGHLEIVSAEGEGTRVRLLLPSAQDETEARRQP